MESVHALLMTVGIVALVLSWLLLLFYSARTDFAWGLCTVLLPPLSYFYGLFRWNIARAPILFAVAGCVLLLLSHYG